MVRIVTGQRVKATGLDSLAMADSRGRAQDMRERRVKERNLNKTGKNEDLLGVKSSF